MPDPVVPSGEEEKIIINGGIAASNLAAICERIYERIEAGYEFPNVKALVIQANLIEDEVDHFRRMYLEGSEFEGPWPHSLRE
jgi:hypothetical protein